MPKFSEIPHIGFIVVSVAFLTIAYISTHWGGRVRLGRGIAPEQFRKPSCVLFMIAVAVLSTIIFLLITRS